MVPSPRPARRSTAIPTWAHGPWWTDWRTIDVPASGSRRLRFGVAVPAVRAGTVRAGEEALFAWRSFEAYRSSRRSRAPPRRVPLTASHHHDRRDAAAITPRTRLVFVCPNNPTGTALRTEGSAFLGRVPSDVVVVLDETTANSSPIPTAGRDGTRPRLPQHSPYCARSPRRGSRGCA